MKRTAIAWRAAILAAFLWGSGIVNGQTPAKVPRVGVLSPTKSSEAASLQRLPFERGLRELGWLPGQSIIIEYRYAEGDIARLPALAAELVHLPVDIIVARTPQGISAAQAATSTVPIVMAASNDPVQQGFVASLARPGGNTTGLAITVNDLGGKQLQFLKSAVPRLKRIGVLMNRQMMNDQDPQFFAGLSAAANSLGVAFETIEISQAEDIAPAFAAMEKQRVDAFLVRGDPHILEANIAQVVSLAATHRIPAMYPWRTYVEAGGLMSYAVLGSIAEVHHRSAAFVDRIVKGASPADMPVEQPLKFELVINLKTAQALGLTLPTTLLIQANEVLR